VHGLQALRARLLRREDRGVQPEAPDQVVPDIPEILSPFDGRCDYCFGNPVRHVCLPEAIV
jgi:hypothetical protein